MSRSWTWRALSSCVIAIGTACASDSTAYRPPAEIESAATVRTFDNGLRVVVAPNHTQPIVTALVGFRSGAFVESEAQSGYSHLLEHMLFKGSQQLPDPVAFEDRLHTEQCPARACRRRRCRSCVHAG
jgi:secreted Zn-dependent insulinase-like peptidase